jgi:glycosyltransferase involved in cell wall biosynthesis
LRIVFVTQLLDSRHPALGATVAQLRALAERTDEVVVLADYADEQTLPANCRLRTFRASTRTVRGLRFGAALGRELRSLRRGGAVVAHMCPIYAVLAAPLARPLRIPVLLWFAHWRAGALLRAAERTATAVATVDERSFPLPSRKVRAIGHGIDLAEFPCLPQNEVRGGPLRVLALGRYSPAKALDVVLRAIAEVEDAELTVHGPTLTEAERAHRRQLGELAAELGLGDRAHLGDAVPREQVPALLARADVLVNNMRAGAPDKVVYEAAASCVPVVVSNPVFDDLVDPTQRFHRDKPAELGACLRGIAELGAEERAALGRRLREQVAKRHSVQRWADGLLNAAQSR